MGGVGAWRRTALTVLLGLGLVVVAGPAVLAQEPSSTPAGGVAGPVDPRSSGEGPGLEAEPLLVLLGVVGLGLGAAAATVVYVRLTRDD